MRKYFIEKYPFFKEALENGHIHLFELNFGGKNKMEIEENLNRQMKITELGRKLLRSENFQIGQERRLKFVILRPSDLGLNGSSLVYKDIIRQARMMNLGSCPHDLLGNNDLREVSGTLSMDPIKYTTWMDTTDEYVFSLSGGALDACNVGVMVQYSSKCRFVFTHD